MESSGIHVILKAEPLGALWGIPITNSLLMTWIAMGLIFLFVFLFRRQIALVPGKLQTTLEWGVEGALGYMTETLEDAKLAKRFFPLIATLFLFILTINLLEFFPGVGSLGFFSEHGFTPLLRASTADLNTALALTLISVITVEVIGFVTLGFFRYGGKFINFSSPLNFVVGLIELVSELGRLVSLSFRLFGNIFAGEVLIAVIGLFAPYVVPVPFMLFEVFVGFVQAVIFALLTLFFIKLAVTPPHDSEAH
ncbi:MAG: F0F1 ATP synthase subunit A [Patescibacteria group bacterium]